jgi:hypothetical protein
MWLQTIEKNMGNNEVASLKAACKTLDLFVAA